MRKARLAVLGFACDCLGKSRRWSAINYPVKAYLAQSSSVSEYGLLLR